MQSRVRQLDDLNAAHRQRVNDMQAQHAAVLAHALGEVRELENECERLTELAEAYQAHLAEDVVTRVDLEVNAAYAEGVDVDDDVMMV
jgi:hypothetical protein